MSLQIEIPGLVDPAVYANSGAWMSRTRRENIRSSLLGQDDGHIKCPRRIILGLKFEDTHPVVCLESILAAAGFRDPEELRAEFAIPQTSLLCRRSPLPPRKHRVARCRPLTVLKQALMLGLCTGQVFDPARPVIWTETSLTRGLELFDPRGFYA